MGGSRRSGPRRVDITYSPLVSQRKFHDSEARFKGFSGPIGSGKSQALCQEAIKLSYQNPGRTGLIGAPTYPMLRDATAAALMEVLDRNKIPHEINRAENHLTMRETKSKILFRAVEEFERLRGSNLAWFGVDELTYTSEQAWLRLEGRLRDPKASRLCGFAVWTPKGYDWVYERFVVRCIAGYETVMASPFENRFLLDRVPDYYERLRSSYDERFFQARGVGRVSESARWARVLRRSSATATWRRRRWIRTSRCCGRWILTWIRCARWWRRSMETAGEGAGRNRAEPGDHACKPARNSRAGFRSIAAGLVIYADATGARMQTSGMTDLAILKQFFRSGEYGDVTFRIPSAESGGARAGTADERQAGFGRWRAGIDREQAVRRN